MPFIKIQEHFLHYAWLDFQRPHTLILINSLGSNLSIWSQMISYLSPYVNLLLHDKRGHGYSSLPSQDSYSIDDYADDVIALMDHCGIKRAHILGLSIGGLITYSLASRYPDRFDKLIFSNTGAQIGSSDMWEERIAHMKQVGLKSMAKDIVEGWLSENFRQLRPQETEGYAHMLSMVQDEGYLAACEALGQADYRAVATDISHQALFVGGGKDMGTPPNFVRTHANQLPHSTYKEIADVAHLPCLESPKELSQLILEFIHS